MHDQPPKPAFRAMGDASEFFADAECRIKLDSPTVRRFSEAHDQARHMTVRSSLGAHLGLGLSVDIDQWTHG